MTPNFTLLEGAEGTLAQTEPLRLTVRTLTEELRWKSYLMEMGVFLGERLLCRFYCPALDEESLTLTFAEHPVSLLLHMEEEDGGVRGTLLALLPDNRPILMDPETWRTPPAGLASFGPMGSGQPFPLGSVFRHRSERRHPGLLRSESDDLARSLLQGEEGTLSDEALRAQMSGATASGAADL